MCSAADIFPFAADFFPFPGRAMPSGADARRLPCHLSSPAIAAAAVSPPAPRGSRRPRRARPGSPGTLPAIATGDQWQGIRPDAGGELSGRHGAGDMHRRGRYLTGNAGESATCIARADIRWRTRATRATANAGHSERGPTLKPRATANAGDGDTAARIVSR
jgi:hypothetical protein